MTVCMFWSIALACMYVCEGSDYSDRAKLMELLHEVGQPAMVDKVVTRNVIKAVDSFFGNGLQYSPNMALLEQGHKTAVTSSPRRRHAPCECPDAPGDADSDRCLSRRFSLTASLEAALQAQDATGVAVETGRLQLRNLFSQFAQTSNDTNAVIAALLKNITDPYKGYLGITNNEAKHLLNKETLLATAINNAWMNLVDESNTAMASIGDVQAMRDNATQAIASWYSDLQTQEENANYINQQKVLDYAWNELVNIANSVTQSQVAVYTALVGLSDSMGGAEGSSSALADSLAAAVDTLNTTLGAFSDSLDDTVQASADKISSSFDNVKSQYETAGQSVVYATTKMAQDKSSDATASGTAQVQDQQSATYAVYQQITNATDNSIQATQAADSQYQALVGSAYGNVTVAVTSPIDALTSSVQSQANSRQVGVSNLDSANNAVRTAMGTAISSEQTELSNSQMSSSNTQRDTQNKVQSVINDMVQAKTNVLTNAQQIESGSVNAVGSETQSSLSQMSSAYNKGQVTLSNQAQSVASSSSSTTGGLSVSFISGSNAMSSAGVGVNNQLMNQYGVTLNSVSGVASNMPSGLPADQIRQAAANNSANTNSMVQIAYDSYGNAVSYSSDASGENSVSGVLSIVGDSGDNATSTIAGVQNGLAVGAQTSAGIAQIGQQTGDSITNAYAGTSGSIADSESNFADYLGSVDGGSFSYTGGDPASYSVVVNGVNVANDLIQKGQSQLDSATSSSDSTNVNGADVGSIRLYTQSTTGNVQAGMDQSLLNSNADVNNAAASLLSDSGTAANQQLASILALNASMAVSVSSQGASQLAQIRDVAASVDSLMDQISSYMNSNNAVLFNQVASLPTAGQQFYNKMQGYTDQANGYSGQVPVTQWDRSIQRMIGAIARVNGTANDLMNQQETVFVQNATAYVSSVLDQVNDLINNYVDTTNALKSQMSAMETSGVVQENSVATSVQNSNSALSGMNSIYSSVQDLANLANQNLTALSSAGQSNPGSLSQAYSTVVNVTSGDSNSTSSAQQVVSGLMDAANGNSNVAQQIQQSGATDSATLLQQQAAQIAANQGAAQATLTQRQNEMAQLQNDTAAAVADFGNQVQAYGAAQYNNASFVYDQINEAQSGTQTAIGNIMSQFVQQQSQTTNTVGTNTASTAAQMALLQQQITQLNSLFDTYLKKVQSEFDLATADGVGFGNAIAMTANQRLSDVDQTILNAQQTMINNQAKVPNQLNNLTVDSFDSDISTLGQELTDWQTTQSSKIGTIKSNLDSIVAEVNTQPASSFVVVQDAAVPAAPVANTGGPFNFATITKSVSDAIGKLANSAITILQNYGVAIPDSIASIAQDPATATSNAYSALSAPPEPVPSLPLVSNN